MSKRLKRLVDIEEKECYLEEVPDEILGEIMSRLKAHEVAQACMVSRRWRNAGTPILSSGRNLDLDFTDEKYKKDRCRLITNRVNSAMKMHRSSQLDSLRIAFSDHTEQIYNHLNIKLSEWFVNFDNFRRWFDFANAKQVTCLDIDIQSCDLVHTPESDRYIAPVSFEYLAGPFLGRLESWDRLTTVSLKSVIIFDHDLHKLLSKSPNLETLLLNNVPLTKLELKDTNSLKLKRLEILHCAKFNSIHIISAPNLESLKHVPLMEMYYQRLKRPPLKKKEYPRGCHLVNTDISLQIENAPRLAHIHLGGPLCRNLMLEYQKYAPQLKSLKLNMDLNCCEHDSCRCLSNSPTFPTLGNLKQLDLSFTSTQTEDHDKHKLHTITSIINSCPRLEKLTLEYDIEKVDVADEDYHYDDCHPNEFLQEVKIAGWSGLQSEIELVLHLIRTSPKLKSLTLDPTPPQMSGFRLFSSVTRTEHELQYAAQVAQQLIGCLPA